MYKLALFFLLLFRLPLSAQEPFALVWSKPVSEDAAWDTDPAGNTYIVDRQTIVKIDSTGKQVLTQSTKSFGTVSKIDASNWLKIALFSEDQQQVCYLDNALGQQSDCIDLSALGVNLAQHFATSGQTDRIWIFDQLNSELQLITIRTNQRQIVQNLRSVADIGNVLQLTEFRNTLYLLDDRGQVILFDNFGTFTGSFQLHGTWLQPLSAGLLLADGHTIRFHHTDNDSEQDFFTGIPGGPHILRFQLIGKQLFVSTKNTLYCFRSGL